MTTHDITESAAGTARKSVDRSASASAGSVILVLLVAGMLVAAAAGFMVLRRGAAERGSGAHAAEPMLVTSAAFRCS